MQQGNLNVYLELISVGQIRPMNRTNAQQAPLYSLTAVGKQTVGMTRGDFNEGSRSFPEVRELDINFIDLTERRAKMLVPQAEVSIFGAVVLTHLAPVHYRRETAGIIAAFAPEYSGGTGLVKPSEIVEGLVTKLGEEYRDILAKILPEQRRATSIRASGYTWYLRANPNQMEAAQDDAIIGSV